MAEESKPSWWTTAPGMLTAIAGLITAVCGLIAALQGAGFLGGGTKDVGKPEIKSDTTASPPTASFNQPQPIPIAQVPGTYSGTVHLLVVLTNNTRQQFDAPATLTIFGPVRQNGDINAQLTLQVGSTSKTTPLQGKIVDGNIMLSDNEMRFVGRYNGGSISGGLSELKTSSIPQSYFSERGIYSMTFTGMDLFRN